MFKKYNDYYLENNVNVNDDDFFNKMQFANKMYRLEMEIRNRYRDVINEQRRNLFLSMTESDAQLLAGSFIDINSSTILTNITTMYVDASLPINNIQPDYNSTVQNNPLYTRIPGPLQQPYFSPLWPYLINNKLDFHDLGIDWPKNYTVGVTESDSTSTLANWPNNLIAYRLAYNSNLLEYLSKGDLFDSTKCYNLVVGSDDEKRSKSESLKESAKITWYDSDYNLVVPFKLNQGFDFNDRFDWYPCLRNLYLKLNKLRSIETFANKISTEFDKQDGQVIYVHGSDTNTMNNKTKYTIPYPSVSTMNIDFGSYTADSTEFRFKIQPYVGRMQQFSNEVPDAWYFDLIATYKDSTGHQYELKYTSPPQTNTGRTDVNIIRGWAKISRNYWWESFYQKELLGIYDWYSYKLPALYTDSIQLDNKFRNYTISIDTSYSIIPKDDTDKYWYSSDLGPGLYVGLRGTYYFSGVLCIVILEKKVGSAWLPVQSDQRDIHEQKWPLLVPIVREWYWPKN